MQTQDIDLDEGSFRGRVTYPHYRTLTGTLQYEFDEHGVPTHLLILTNNRQKPTRVPLKDAIVEPFDEVRFESEAPSEGGI